jgi:hypothetical protein
MEAAGVLDSDASLSKGVAYSLDWYAETVGERLVKGWWKAEAHLGVPGTEGKGYDGVLRAWPWPAGVGGMLPRMVRADSVDSVDVVWAEGSGPGLLKAPSSVGDILAMGSSLIGDTRRALMAAKAAAPGTLRMRVRCCFCSISSWSARSRSISTSSGDALSYAASPWPGPPASSEPPRSCEPSSSSLMSVVSVADVSPSWSVDDSALCVERGIDCEEKTVLLAAMRCKGGRAVVVGEVCVCVCVGAEEAVSRVSLEAVEECCGVWVIPA